MCVGACEPVCLPIAMSGKGSFLDCRVTVHCPAERERGLTELGKACWPAPEKRVLCVVRRAVGRGELLTGAEDMSSEGALLTGAEDAFSEGALLR